MEIAELDVLVVGRTTSSYTGPPLGHPRVSINNFVIVAAYKICSYLAKKVPLHNIGHSEHKFPLFGIVCSPEAIHCA